MKKIISTAITSQIAFVSKKLGGIQFATQLMEPRGDVMEFRRAKHYQIMNNKDASVRHPTSAPTPTGLDTG